MSTAIAPGPCGCHQAEQSELLTPAEAADLLGCKVQTLSVWRCVGRYSLPYVKLGRLIRYRKSDLLAWLQSRTVNHTGELVGAER